MLSPEAAQRLGPVLDAFVAGFDARGRVRSDPVELVRRYSAAADVEVAALFASSLAYGRVDLFKPKLARLFADMGGRPGEFVRRFHAARDLEPFRNFVYRFNVGADLAVLALAAKALVARHGSLGAAVAAAFRKTGEVRGALSAVAREVHSVDRRALSRRLGPVRSLDHLFPDPSGGGACKRQMLLLRWMVRGPDEVDLGIWRGVPPSALVMPLDTHVARVARRLGLTSRRAIDRRTAEDITASLRLVDPLDPVRYDFALCHLGMSGGCPPRLVAACCRRCPLRGACPTGRP